MNALRTTLVGALVSSALALPAFAQIAPRLAVGPDAGGYLCPDGRQLYVKSCYDASPRANCGVVNMHLPLQRGYQTEYTETRENLAGSVMNCKVFPVVFNNGVVNLAQPKSVAAAPAPAQPQKPQPAGPVAKPSPLWIAPAGSPMPGTGGKPFSLVRLPVADDSSFFADELSFRPTAEANIIEMWSLTATPYNNNTRVTVRWSQDFFNCKEGLYGQGLWIEVNGNNKLLETYDLGAVKGMNKIPKGVPIEIIAAYACKTLAPIKTPRLTSIQAAVNQSVQR